jgi:hypothetical protein
LLIGCTFGEPKSTAARQSEQVTDLLPAATAFVRATIGRRGRRVDEGSCHEHLPKVGRTGLDAPTLSTASTS